MGAILPNLYVIRSKGTDEYLIHKPDCLGGLNHVIAAGTYFNSEAKAQRCLRAVEKHFAIDTCVYSVKLESWKHPMWFTNDTEVGLSIEEDQQYCDCSDYEFEVVPLNLSL